MINKYKQYLPVYKRIVIKSFKSNSVLSSILPVEGIIVKRLKLADSNRCFMVRLDQPFIVDGEQHDYIYIKTKENEASIEKGESHIVYFMLAEKPALYSEESPGDEFQFIDWAVVSSIDYVPVPVA